MPQALKVISMARFLSYDEDSGQVYTETTFDAQSMVSTWTTFAKGKAENPRTYRNTQTGSATLYETALRVCSWNATLLTPEALQCAGWPYAQRIYKRLRQQYARTPSPWETAQRKKKLIGENATETR